MICGPAVSGGGIRVRQAEGERRVVLAVPAAGQGSRTHEAAVRRVEREWPGFEVCGPHPSWDKIRTLIGARSYLSGADVFVFAGWRGYLSRGVDEMVGVSPRILTLRGNVLFLSGGKLYRKWTTEDLARSGGRSRGGCG